MTKDWKECAKALNKWMKDCNSLNTNIDLDTFKEILQDCGFPMWKSLVKKMEDFDFITISGNNVQIPRPFLLSKVDITLAPYYANICKKAVSIRKKNSTVELTEEICIAFLKATGKYKIFVEI